MPGKVPPLPRNEKERLQALLRYNILDTATEPVFDNITRLTAKICNTPIAVVTLIDEQRQWIKSSLGFEKREIPRNIAFCAYTILGRELVVIKDATKDPRFSENPLVTEEPKIRFYAGAPLITPDGHAIGTLAVVDRVPSDLSAYQRSMITMLAEHVVSVMELRRTAETGGKALRAIVHTSPRAIVSLDSEGRPVIWNEAAEQIFGYPSKEAVGAELRIFSREQEPEVRDLFERVTRGDVVRGYETTATRKDGKVRDISIAAAPLKGNEGEPPSILMMADDITDHKRADRDLQRSCSLLRATLDSTADGIIVVDRDWNVLTYNKTFLDIWRIPQDQVSASVGEPEIDFGARQVVDPETFARRMREIGATPEAESFDTIELKDGRTLERYSRPERINGTVVGRVWSFRDVTTAVQRQREIERSLSLLRATLEATADGLLALDNEGRILTFNDRLAEMWHLPRSILEARDSKAVVDAAMEQLRDPEYFREKVRRYLDGEQLETMDMLQFRDGRVFERYAHPQVVGGAIVGHVFSYRDVTRRLQLEEQLRQAQKMEALGQLAGGIAHDFNNLLNVIVGYTALIQSRTEEDETLHSHLDQVMKAADRATALTRQLLVFSRKQVVEPQVLDPNKHIASLSKMLPRVIGEDIELNVKLASDLWSVKADPGQIEQVILNLVINARDAMPHGGNLVLETANVTLDQQFLPVQGTSDGSYVMISVSDTGEGVPEEIKSRIFEPFFTTKQPGKGTGLGLATAYAIVRQGGGFIDVQSEAGKGSTFRVYLPRARQAPQDTRPVTMRGEEYNGTETLLVVEDESSLRELISHVLRSKGYTVLEARNGEEAVQVAKEHAGKIHMLVTDVVMPGMRGWEVTQTIAGIRPDTKVLYISGYAEDNMLGRRSLNDSAAFLQKPFSPQALARKVREVLGPAADINQQTA